MRLFVTSILAKEPWKYDSRVIPMPWREPEEAAVISKISSSGLTLGYYSYDGVVSASLRLKIPLD
jgi:amidase